VVFYVFGLKVNWDRVWYRLGTVRRRSGSQGQAESAVQLAVQIWRSNGATVFRNSKNYNTIFLFAEKKNCREIDTNNQIEEHFRSCSLHLTRHNMQQN
jgi:hypothetical protein